MKPHQWHVISNKLLRTILFTLCFFSLQSYALNWVIVTSEADSGAGTLREAISLVNGGGTDAPDAIAFANNVQNITIQSNLPAINNPVVIDGLAIANIANPNSTVEGDCSLLPSPVDNPEGFSDSIRVTIDGSGIPINIDPDTRYGLLFDEATIRGIRIQNISAPGNGSYAVGLLSVPGPTPILVECCEIKNIQNTASTTAFNENRAAGIEGADLVNETTISKCYIHNIEGGAAITNCEEFSTAINSGHAYGVLNCTIVESCRIKCITGGSINAVCSDDLRASAGRSAGIALSLRDPGLPDVWPCSDPGRTIKTGVDNCPIACDQECDQIPVCIRNNLISNIYGGSIITNLPEAILTEVTGIMLGSTFELADELTVDALVQNNTIQSIRSGSLTTLGDNAINIVLGSFGILNNSNTSNVTINCNSIENIETGNTTLEGQSASAFPGYTYGIWSKTDNLNNASTTCNTISHVCGPTATSTGICSYITDSIDETCGMVDKNKHTPGGLSCADSLQPTVSGIIIEDTSPSSLYVTNNNSIKNVTGGKRVAQGEQSSVNAFGSAGIYLNSNSLQLCECNQNNIASIIGAELIAKPGSLSAIKKNGTTGLCLTASNITTQQNNIDFVCEGLIQAAHQSLGANLTNIFFGLLEAFKQPHSKQLELDTAQPYAPVITSGIVVSHPGETPFMSRACTDADPYCISDNDVHNVIGSSVTGGTQLLGSIAAGIWIQPIADTKSKSVRSFESCADARQNDLTNGTASNNIVHTIIGGTNAPAYGIFLDGSAQFFNVNATQENRESTFFTLETNTVTDITGSRMLPVFDVTLSALLGMCPGSSTESQEKTAFPFLPFEPSSGIYTLFGGCSTLSGNIVSDIKAFKAEARGITTAASSDMLITENSCSKVQGYGIFVGGVYATNDDAALLGTDPNELTLESFASVRNKIHTNSIFNNCSKGIKLGLVDWSSALFGIQSLNVCPNSSFFRAPTKEIVLDENAIFILGNHGQPEPCVHDVICNSNGTITIEIDLQNTHPLTSFIVQFFKNSTATSTQGEQAISSFDDTPFVFTTDFNGRAQKKFTFTPLAKIESNDNITAHVTVNENGQSTITNAYFSDTSEFGGQSPNASCNQRIVSKPQNKPSSTSGFAAILNNR